MSQLPPANGADVGQRMGMEAVRETLRIARPVAEVWRAWTDPGWLAGWHAERVDGELAAGGAIRLGWDSLGIAIDLEVVAMEPPARLVLCGAPPGRPPQTLSVILAGVGHDTEMAIQHEGFVGEEERAGTAAGWHVSARILAHYLARHPGRQRRCAAALAPVAASLEVIARRLARPAWLLGDVSLGAEGSAWRGGTVLASALPRQIALVLDDAAGIVVLRAIRLDPGAALVGALAWSWEPERKAYAELVGALAPAIERLAADLGGGRGDA